MRSGETLDTSDEIEGHQPRRWGMGDAAAGLLLANVCAVLGGSLILAATRNQSTDYEDLPLTMVAVLQVPLWLGYLGAPLWAARTKGNGIVADFGFRTRWMDAPIGLAIGVATLSQKRLQEKEGRLLKLVSGLVMVALGVYLVV